MIDKDQHINELYALKHRHDDQGNNAHFDYENKFFEKTMSNVMMRNPKTSEFLTKLQVLAVMLIESTYILRNYYNYTTNRYYDKHNN